MLKEVTATGKDIEIAKENARAALGAGPLDDVSFEIIDLGSRGFLGFMAKPAKVKATMETPDVHEPKPRRERPARAAQDTNAQTASDSEQAAPANRQENAKSGKNKKHKKHGDRKPRAQRQDAQESENNKIHSEVIPEPELKMERREVAQGEDMSYDFVKTVISDIGLNAEAELYACED